MGGKTPYEEVKLEIVLFEFSDVVTSSAPLDDSGNYDDGGWT